MTTIEYSCSLGHWSYRVNNGPWTYIDNKEVLRRLNEYEVLKAKENNAQSTPRQEST